MSPRHDSSLSTTSDEYFDCSSSPLHDQVIDPAGFHNHATTGDHDSFMNSNSPNDAMFTSASPVHVNNTTWAENGADDEKDERPTEGGYQARADHHQESIEVVEMDKKAQQAPKRKQVPNQSAARGLVDGGGAPGESTNSTTKGLFPDGVRPDEDQVEDDAALRPSGGDRRDRPQSPRETERQKV